MNITPVIVVYKGKKNHIVYKFRGFSAASSCSVPIGSYYCLARSSPFIFLDIESGLGVKDILISLGYTAWIEPFDSSCYSPFSG